MPTVTLRLRDKHGEHALIDNDGKCKRVIKPGELFKQTVGDGELTDADKFPDKFEVIGGKATDEELDKDPEVSPWVDKTDAFPIAKAKQIKVERNRETKEYRLVDSAGTPIPDTEDLKDKSSIEAYFEAIVDQTVKQPKKKKK